MQLELAFLEVVGATFLEAKDMLSPLSVTQMTFNELELELELLREVHAIFKGKGPESASNSMQEVVTMYEQRIRDIENEIFERRVLV